jgi:tetrahydromethanopterin S-methyltransferase subunit B
MREVLKAIRETIVLSQRVETLGSQVNVIAQTSREEINSLRTDMMDLRERVVRLETYVDVAKMMGGAGRKKLR